MSGILLALLLQTGMIHGLYLEDRSNHVHGCYCEWSGESQTGGREAVLAWHFLGGAYGGVDLAGARAAAVVRGEATLSMGQATRSSVLFIDASTPEQRRAVEAMLRDKYGYFFGRLLRVAHTQIEMEVHGNGGRVRIPGALALEVRKAILPDDALPGATRWYDPFVPLQEAELGTRVLSRFTAPDFGYVWNDHEPATSGYFGRFVLYPR
ncbi:MAG: hypothetical protein KatS3mg004_0722 [Bryobacteraceae bacterium]|nr:MAG: hypothetical protein KatS3mg004_0722 [Bryobacteraceae bacterium]